MQEAIIKDLNLQTILESNNGAVKAAVNRVEKELQVLRGAINYSVEEIIELIQEDPRFIEKMKDSVLKSSTFKKKVLQEFLDFLEKQHAAETVRLKLS